MPWLPVIFLALPFTELMLLLQVGSKWGVMPTLGLIIVTAMVGYTLFRHQGIATWREVNKKLNEGQLPSQEMTEGIVILLAGALMVTPGLITDVIGLLCLLPITRKPFVRMMASRLSSKVSFHSSSQRYQFYDVDDRGNPTNTSGNGNTFEGEAEDISPDKESYQNQRLPK
ncbi:MAG: FxsA family protein [Gammaproteobacteria bacterium]|nr:FxsA family protein [Gammaproteobacteria bacterium]